MGFFTAVSCARSGIGYHKGLRRLRSGFEPRRTHQKDGFYPSFFMRVSRRAKLNRGDPFGVSVDAEGCGFARREEECPPQNHSDNAAHKALCRSIPSQKTKPVFVIFHFTMSEEKIICRHCLHNVILNNYNQIL